MPRFAVSPVALARFSRAWVTASGEPRAESARPARPSSAGPHRKRCPPCSRSRNPAPANVEHNRYTVGSGSPVASAMAVWVHSGWPLNSARTSKPRSSVFREEGDRPVALTGWGMSPTLSQSGYDFQHPKVGGVLDPVSPTTIAEVIRCADAAAAELGPIARSFPAVRFQGMPSDADCRPVYEGLGERSLIGLHCPAGVGGGAMTPLHPLALEERLGYHWMPLSSYLLSVKTIGNALLQFSRPLAERLLPDIAGGRLVFCQGFSEPEAGSDLAALRTTGRVRSDRLVISGRKIWTSSVEEAD